MWKKILIALLILIAIIIIMVVVVGRYLGDTVEAGLTEYGPEITGTPIEVGDVNLSVRESRGVVRDLIVGNPEGYEGEFAVRLPLAEMDIELSSLLEDTIVIHRMRVRGTEVRLETQDEVMNLRKIQQNVGDALGDDEADPPEDRKKYIVDEFVMEGGEVSVRDSDLEVDLPEMRLEGLGRESGGLLGEELVQRILDATIEEMVPLLGEQATGLTDDPEGAMSLAERATSALQGLLGGDDDGDESQSDDNRSSD